MWTTKKVKFKLIITAVAFLVSISLLVTATMAWFTLSTNPEIGGIKVNVFTSLTLLVSSDGEHYGQYLDVSDMFGVLEEPAVTDESGEVVKGKKSLTLDELHPVSTLDGIHWFIPTYAHDDVGSLNPASMFILDEVPLDMDAEDRDAFYLSDGYSKYGNVRVEEGYDNEEDEIRGYYIYADIYLKTEDPDGCRVRLSVPNLDSNGKYKLEKGEEESGIYGTYVLENFKYEQVADEGGERKDEFYTIGNAAETAMRVGFLIREHTDEDEGKFVIYEPNADKRSSAGKPSADEYNGEEFYILDSTSTEDDIAWDYLCLKITKTTESGQVKYKDTNGKTYSMVDNGGITYFYPQEEGISRRYICCKNEGNVYYCSDYIDGNYYETCPIGYVPPDEDSESTKGVGAVMKIDPANLIVQRKSEWDLTKLEKAIKDKGDVTLLETYLDAMHRFFAEEGEEETYKSGYIKYSNYVKKLGNFMSSKELYKNMDKNGDRSVDVTSEGADALTKDSIAGDSIILTLTPDDPVAKIRLCVWIEGQDPDCWNDISSGSFIVNLELAGESGTGD